MNSICNKINLFIPSDEHLGSYCNQIFTLVYRNTKRNITPVAINTKSPPKWLNYAHKHGICRVAIVNRGFDGVLLSSMFNFFLSYVVEMKNNFHPERLKDISINIKLKKEMKYKRKCISHLV